MTMLRWLKFNLLVLSIVFLENECYQEDSTCPKVNKCRWPEPDQPSIIVTACDGRLGNKMNEYVSLMGLKMKFNAEVYMARDKLAYLTPFFPDLEIKAAEDHVCNFQRDYKVVYQIFHMAFVNKQTAVSFVNKVHFV